jgi:hypothetical protein
MTFFIDVFLEKCLEILVTHARWQRDLGATKSFHNRIYEVAQVQALNVRGFHHFVLVEEALAGSHHRLLSPLFGNYSFSLNLWDLISQINWTDYCDSFLHNKLS